MSSVLSEIKNTLQTLSIKDSVVDMYQTTITKLSEVKDVFLKKENPEILPKIVKDAKPVKDEGYASPPKPKTSKEIIIATLTKVKDTLWEYGLKFFFIFFYIMLASFVANDMIMYAAPIRAFFFIFTWFFTSTLFPCAFFVALYYLLKRGYDYYNKNLSSAKDKPPQSFPTIFAILPLTTYYPTSPFIRFFLWIFMYQKSDKPERMKKENDRLEIIMKNYWNDLNGSFEYLDKIKNTEPFKELYENIEKKLTIEGMHPIQKPKTVEPSTTPDTGTTEEKNKKEENKKKDASMPATIASQAVAPVQGSNTLPLTPNPLFPAPQSTSLPSTISQSATQPAPQSTSLPATISKSATQQAPQSTSLPASQSATQPAPQSATQPASQSATQQAPQSTSNPPSQPASSKTLGWANSYPELKSLESNLGRHKPIDAQVAEGHRLSHIVEKSPKSTLRI
jgi:hypothetical protein